MKLKNRIIEPSQWHDTYKLRKPNGDDEHLFEGQAQGGGKDDNVLTIPPLEKENIFINVLHEGDTTF